MQNAARPVKPTPRPEPAPPETQRPWALRLLRRARDPSSDNVIAGAPKDDALLAFVPEQKSDTSTVWDDRSKRRMLVGLLAALSVAIATILGYYVQRWFFAAEKPAELSVQSNPPGAEVLLGGQRRGVTPLKLSVAPGAHRLEVRRGDVSRVLPIDVRPGSEALHYIDLPTPPPVAAPTGALQISTEPPGATVSIDGKSAGTTPLTLKSVPAGEHQVVLASGGVRVRRTVQIQPGATASLVASLSATDALGGWLSVASDLPLQVLADGALVGTSDSKGISRIMLPVGSRKIAVENAATGFRHSYSVSISAGKTSTLKVNLPRGVLHVNALPWAEVLIDGKSFGETPISGVELPIGPHNVVFRHPQLGERRTTVLVVANGPTRVGVDMNK